MCREGAWAELTAGVTCFGRDSKQDARIFMHIKGEQFRSPFFIIFMHFLRFDGQHRHRWRRHGTGNV